MGHRRDAVALAAATAALAIADDGTACPPPRAVRRGARRADVRDHGRRLRGRRRAARDAAAAATRSAGSSWCRRFSLGVSGIARGWYVRGSTPTRARRRRPAAAVGRQLDWVFGFPPLITVLLLLLFPDGRLPSRRWRPVGWAVGATLACWRSASPSSPEPSTTSRASRTRSGSGSRWAGPSTRSRRRASRADRRRRRLGRGAGGSLPALARRRAPAAEVDGPAASLVVVAWLANSLLDQLFGSTAPSSSRSSCSPSRPAVDGGDPPLPPLRHRGGSQPHARLRRADRRSRRRPTSGVVLLLGLDARPVGRRGRRSRRSRSPRSSSPPARASRTGRPPVLPRALRRRPHARGVQRPAARRGRPRRGARPSSGRGRATPYSPPT